MLSVCVFFALQMLILTADGLQIRPSGHFDRRATLPHSTYRHLEISTSRPSPPGGSWRGAMCGNFPLKTSIVISLFPRISSNYNAQIINISRVYATLKPKPNNAHNQVCFFHFTCIFTEYMLTKCNLLLNLKKKQIVHFVFS